MSRVLSAALLGSLSLYASVVFSAGGRADYDLDDDGLIEINDLADLDEIRNNLDGTSLYGASTGCPSGICTGFELTTDLDFDTNGNGETDAGDTFWNSGEGWMPIGPYDWLNPEKIFTGTFEGNNHKILNLYINKPTLAYAGLFGTLDGANISHLELSGELTSIYARNNVGFVAGNANKSNLTEIYVSGRIEGRERLGLVVGSIRESVITAVATTGQVGVASDVAENDSSGGNYFGGVAGSAYLTPISASLTTANIYGWRNSGGFIGREGELKESLSLAAVVAHQDEYYGALVGQNIDIFNSHWPTEIGNNKGWSWYSSATGSFEASLAELKCPTAADDLACSDKPLYEGWASHVNAQGAPYWNFGSVDQLPGLNILGRVIRDSDGDSIYDHEDAFPFQFAIAVDKDGDGYADGYTRHCDKVCQLASGVILDEMPDFVAAHSDSDGDGRPEGWNTACTSSCQSTSGLIIDTHPNDVDNDGIDDVTDTDDNGDGKTDADSDSNGLIEIASLQEFNAIRFDLKGHSKKASASALSDTSGCPLQFVNNGVIRQCRGYELVADIDFDSNGDGVIDSSDDYWNDGKGFQPIGSLTDEFAAVFDGNNHKVLNLYIDDTSDLRSGLFGYAIAAELRRVEISGDLTYVASGQNSGVLAGSIIDTLVTDVFVDAELAGSSWHRGFVAGYADRSVIRNCATSGVANVANAGGVLGAGGYDTVVEACLTSVTINSEDYHAAGITSLYGGDVEATLSLSSLYIKDSPNREYAITGLYGTASNSYWPSEQNISRGAYTGGVNEGVYPATIEALKCPVSADDEVCFGKPLYMGWADFVNIAGEPVWDFGTASQLPGLNILGRVIRDSDGDGEFDDQDAWPENPAVAVDADGDGYPDEFSWLCDLECQISSGFELDAFPQSFAAYRDADGDSQPDVWNPACNSSCRNNSGLVLDAFLQDIDNDGINDITDSDDNNDGVVDIDADSDGLIEISTLAELNAMRFSLDGRGRKMGETAVLNTSGCPVRVVDGVYERTCRGYELMNDLDFDTDGNGVINASDEFWNLGEGWEPVGSTTNEIDAAFSASFNGNNHKILNFFINRPTAYWQGLFGVARNAEFSAIELSGAATHIFGGVHVGLLLGWAQDSSIKEVYVEGIAEATYADVGLVAGYCRSCTVTAVASSGRVSSNTDRSNAGGLIGSADNTIVSASFSSGSVYADRYAGGLVGRGGSIQASYSLSEPEVASSSYIGALQAWGDVANSYWPEELIVNKAAGYGNVVNSFSAARVQLKCPTAANDTLCFSSPLYVGWEAYKDTEGQIYWNFGSSEQLPGLRILGKMIRDADGDGVMDHHDAFPNDFEVSGDSDGDGYPETFNDGCDATCQSNSTVEFDLFPGNPDEALDTDSDGIGNNADTDDDNDGLSDTVEAGYAFLDPHNAADADGDYDNDGYSNREELEQGFDPSSSTSSPGPVRAIKYDMNGDGSADLLWRKSTTGGVKLVATSNTAEQDYALNLQASSAEWSVQLGDFNGDRIIDQFWRNNNDSRAVIELSSNSGDVAGEIQLSTRDTGWSSSIGDFNGDGADDILWRRGLSGEVELHISNSSGAVARVEKLLSKYAAWTHQLGDFNGDNRTDILWRKVANGDVKVALSDANGNQASVTNHFNKWAAWESTIGDFNGDHRDDILWRKVSSGDVKIAISGVDGGQESVAKHYAKYAAWTHTVGDFNGDGADDILWRKIANGLVKVAVSDAQGQQAFASNHYNKYVAWQHFIGDYNGDGKDDILWRKPASGDVKIAISDVNAAQASVAKHYSKGDAWSLVH